MEILEHVSHSFGLRINNFQIIFVIFFWGNVVRIYLLLKLHFLMCYMFSGNLHWELITVENKLESCSGAQSLMDKCWGLQFPNLLYSFLKSEKLMNLTSKYISSTDFFHSCYLIIVFLNHLLNKISVICCHQREYDFKLEFEFLNGSVY